MKIIVVLALVAVAVAEPPSSYGAPDFNFISGGGGGGYDSNDGAQFVDAELLGRVAQILGSSSGGFRSHGYQSQAPSNSYGPPSNSYGAPSEQYGAPSQFRQGGGGGISLGHPEIAHRVAEWSSSSSSGIRGGGIRGGYA